MQRTLKVLAPTRYPWRFNSPRHSRHHLSIRSFLPLNYLSEKLEGFTVFSPFPPEKFDLVHAFNRIPLGTTPFVIGFESHLPRAFNCRSSLIPNALSEMLSSDRCKGIVAISEYARCQFLHQHRASPHLNALQAKLSVRYPNLFQAKGDVLIAKSPTDTLRLVFVGNHFARKGGSVAVRMAKIAHQNGRKIELDIVSTMQLGAKSWVTPTRNEYWAQDLQDLVHLPNIRHHDRLPNKDVLELVSRAHFALLPTFSDSFGYSVIEAMSVGTPVIATSQGALSEFVLDGVNGALLSLSVDKFGEWTGLSRSDRETKNYEAFFDIEVNRLALEAIEAIERFTSDSNEYLKMRGQARATALRLFNNVEASLFWDDYYSRAVAA